MREVFENRLRRRLLREREPGVEGPLSFVLPVSVEEVEFLAEVAERHYVPLIAQGARTGYEPGSEKGGILVRFDLMRRTRLPADFEEPWAGAEPGALWLELDNDLHARGRGLAVYPTSAPRATVGGWLAMDGLGVGSFEYGWLHENVLSADVVLPGGERRTVQGEDLRSLIGPGGKAGIVVGAMLKTRRADADVPFAVTFGNLQDLIISVATIAKARIPLWHLAFLNHKMASARGLGEDYLLFGAYPGERATEVEKGFRGVLQPYHGRVLSVAEANRVWDKRFFPVVPSHPTPSSTRKFTSVEKLPEDLGGAGDRSEHAVQGTIALSGEVLLLTFDLRKEGWTR